MRGMYYTVICHCFDVHFCNIAGLDRMSCYTVTCHCFDVHFCNTLKSRIYYARTKLQYAGTIDWQFKKYLLIYLLHETESFLRS
jgi:hypothetical protein